MNLKSSMVGWIVLTQLKPYSDLMECTSKVWVYGLTGDGGGVYHLVNQATDKSKFTMQK